MAEESVLATPKLDTDQHAKLKAGVPIVISHDAVTGRYVAMCNTMPGTDTTFVCAQCGVTCDSIGALGYHSQGGRCYFAYKLAVMIKYSKSKDPDVTAPVIPPFFTKVVSERLPTFPVSIKNFKTIPTGEKELFDKAFPHGKPVFKWFNKKYKKSINDENLTNPEPLFTRFEKYYFLFPAVGSGHNLKPKIAKLQSALAASEAKNAANEAKLEEYQKYILDSSTAMNATIVEKPGTKKFEQKTKKK